MGTDINSWAEVREVGVWRKVGRIWPARYARSELTAEPYGSRNYYTFAILAGVRNFVRITPIAGPRGWPVDVTAEGKQEHEQWLCGDSHCASWHSLRHLLEYPHWQTTFTQEGILNGPLYAAMKQGALPDLWWWTSDGRTLVDEDHLAAQLALGNNTQELFVRTKWVVSYHKAAEEFVTETIPRLLSLASPDPGVLSMGKLALAGETNALKPLQDWLEEHDRPGLDDVRMVFCFDH